MWPVSLLIVAVQDQSFLSARPAPEWALHWPWPAAWVRTFKMQPRREQWHVLVQPQPESSGCAAWTNTSLDESGGWIATGGLIFLLNRTIFTVCYLPSFSFHLSQSIQWVFLIYSSRKNVRSRLYIFISVFFSRLCVMKYLSDPSPSIKC